MHEKKMSTGVIRVRMNTCTIVALILVPFLLFILYAILFSQCSELLKNSGMRNKSPKFDNMKNKDNENEQPKSDEEVRVDIYKALGLSDNDGPIALINKVQLNEDNENNRVLLPENNRIGQNSLKNVEEIPLIYSIVRIIVLPDDSDSVSDSSEDTDQQNVRKDVDKHNDEERGDELTDQLWMDIFSHYFSIPREPTKKEELSTASDNGTEKIVSTENVAEEYENQNNTNGKNQSENILSEKDEKQHLETSFESNSESVSPKDLKTDSELKINETSEIKLYGSEELHNMYYQFIDFSIPNTLICPDEGKTLNLLIGIQSDAENFDQRMAIRETWAKLAKVDGLNYAFIVGIGASDSIDNKLKHESDKFQDMIQTDILARHKYSDANSVMFLKWIKIYCPHVKYVIKADDNVFLNLAKIGKFILDNEVRNDTMYGDIYVNELPERDPFSESYVSRQLFPGEIYPDFLNHAGYLFPGKFAPVLFEEAAKFPYFPKENILITGILAEKLNITREDVSYDFIDYSEAEEQLEKCSFLKYSVIYPVTPEGMRSMWDEIKTTCYNYYNFMPNMLSMMKVEGGSDDIREQQVKLLNLLNDENFTPKNSNFEKLFL